MAKTLAEVSVVIPCFNQGHYLDRTLESVLAQSMNDWEAIVVDDGSTDDTAQVARGRGDPRIRYLYQENRGLSGARNTGIGHTAGQFVTFLDADDEWEPAFLERCLAAAAKGPEVPGVYTGTWFIDEEGRRLLQGDVVAIPRELFRRRLLEGGFFPVHAALVRRDALKKSGGFDEALTSVEDWDLWLRLSEQGGMVSVPERLARYRVYVGSMSTDATRMQANRLAVLAKYFGPATDEPETWREEKRYAYGFAHRAAALAFLAQDRPERCWQEMETAATYWPAMLERLDTYYELVCGGQAKGYRGTPAAEEVQVNGEQMLIWLEDSFAGEDDHRRGGERRAFGQAYLALAMLAEQAGDWRLGRQYIRQALKANASLARDSRFVRRILKLYAGKRALAVYKQWA